MLPSSAVEFLKQKNIKVTLKFLPHKNKDKPCKT